ncbi:hypothetical protein GUJ93_ZPchr0011g27780 [Zizania palustris]|uniref:Uncharacterized protein n=1 Tax=Zizania palustris TaxID=103762 RepID=A0A8J5WIB5_ZIZPA|nr:hypothetical protein GUJ93_ZPchr0011g27780 [Zizania palustris]
MLQAQLLGASAVAAAILPSPTSPRASGLRRQSARCWTRHRYRHRAVTMRIQIWAACMPVSPPITTSVVGHSYRSYRLPLGL